MASSETKFPLPPDELIDRVVSGFSNETAKLDRELFLRGGFESRRDIERALASVGAGLTDFERILEFGCGCGRIMRWLEDIASERRLVGTDIDQRAIAWASDNLPFASFDVNGATPPTRYEDGEFDLVINHSVFTHLDEQYQDLWLAELQRITAPGGVLVLSVHGEHAFWETEKSVDAASAQGREWRGRLERHGILFVADDGYVGSAFPDFYHSTFHAPWYIFEHWSRWFEVLAYMPRSSLAFQDQVVLRRATESSGERAPVIGARRGASQTPVEPAQARPELYAAIDGSMRPPAVASRFGSLGALARRLLFRAARPIIYAQGQAARGIVEALERVSADQSSNARTTAIMHGVLGRHAERMDRIERELEAARRALGEADKLSEIGGSAHAGVASSLTPVIPSSESE